MIRTDGWKLIVWTVVGDDETTETRLRGSQRVETIGEEQVPNEHGVWNED
jgi:hypothetical protein